MQCPKYFGERVPGRCPSRPPPRAWSQATRSGRWGGCWRRATGVPRDKGYAGSRASACFFSAGPAASGSASACSPPTPDGRARRKEPVATEPRAPQPGPPEGQPAPAARLADAVAFAQAQRVPPPPRRPPPPAPLTRTPGAPRAEQQGRAEPAHVLGAPAGTRAGAAGGARAARLDEVPASRLR